MSGNRLRGAVGAPLSVGGIVLRFAFVGFVVVTLVAALSAWLSQRAGREEAIDDSREITRLIALGIVEPAVTDDLLEMNTAGIQAMDEVMRRSVVRGSLVRVKIWAADGTVLYSDRRELIGQRFELGDDELKVLAGGPTEAEVSDLNQPENNYESNQGQLLEAYSRITGPDGEPLLFEGYFRYSAVVDAGRSQWSRYAPVSLGALLLLELAQIPIVWTVTRRLRTAQQEREMLLQNAVDASDAERRRIASDLHDGVVQDLTGVSLSLAALAQRTNGAAPDPSVLAGAGDQVRESVKSLRSLLVEIYPPNLATTGLEAAVIDLLARCSNRGVATNLECDPAVETLGETTLGLLYRGAQEALRNVLKHAHATRVDVRVTVADDRVMLVVDDDGVGVNRVRFEQRPAEGHLGVRVLGDLVANSDGDLVLGTSPLGGASFRMSLPLHTAPQPVRQGAR
jgi:two-component system, NarL family, sensor kinase